MAKKTYLVCQRVVLNISANIKAEDGDEAQELLSERLAGIDGLICRGPNDNAEISSTEPTCTEEL